MSISMKTTAAIALALATATVSTSVSAATTLNVSTGQGANGTIDPNWTLNSGNAFIPVAVNSAWNGGVTNPAGTNGAKWITPSANGNQSYDPFANNDYTYATVFTLPNIAGLTAISLAGTFWADNEVLEILLNGVNILAAPGGTFNGTGTVFSATLPSQFVTGTNTLSFKVRNLALNGGNPTGLKVSALVTAVPEPGTWLLMLMGFGFVGFQMRRRQKTQVRFQFA